MTQQITSLVINNQVVDIRRDDEGRVNLNDLYRASEKGETKKPKIYLRSKKAKKLVESLTGTFLPINITGTGRYAETYAHEDIALAYAAWIDNDFYTAVARTFGHAARGDGDAAVETAQNEKSFCSTYILLRYYNEVASR